MVSYRGLKARIGNNHSFVSVHMPMVNIRHVGMFMFQRFMGVYVRMCQARVRHIGMQVMMVPIIVPVPVVMGDRFMAMPVGMFFSEQQDHG